MEITRSLFRFKKQVRIYSPFAALVFQTLGFDVRQVSETCYIVTYESES